MKDMMSYNGYYGSVHYSDEDGIFFGKLEFVNCLVTYEGTDVSGLRKGFEESVNAYLEFCKQQNQKPEKPFKGSFNVRTGSDLHRKAVLYAKNKGINLNKVVAEALEKYLSA